MAILAMSSTASENVVSECSHIFNALQASKMPAHPCAGETRIDQRLLRR